MTSSRAEEGEIYEEPWTQRIVVRSNIHRSLSAPGPLEIDQAPNYVQATIAHRTELLASETAHQQICSSVLRTTRRESDRRATAPSVLRLADLTGRSHRPLLDSDSH